MDLLCDAPLCLETADYSATIVPSAGGRVSKFTWRHADRSHDLLVPWNEDPFESHSWPKAGAFPMIPFTNRIPRTGFVFRGRQYRPLAGPNGFSVHGFLHRRTWEVLTVTRECVEMRCTHHGNSESWPWAFSALQQVRLGTSGLSVTFTLTNHAVEPMPMALGWHPYHPITSDAGTKDISFIAAYRHDLNEEGRAHEQGDTPIFRMERGETGAFSGWKDGFMLRVATGPRIRITGDGWTNLVLHRPGAGDYLCVEPTTLLPGHLGMERSQSDVLEPGESRQATWSCAVWE